MMHMNIFMRRPVVVRIDEQASRELFHINPARDHNRHDRSHRHRHFHLDHSTQRACRIRRVVHQISANKLTFAEKDRYRVAWFFSQLYVVQSSNQKSPASKKKTSTSFTDSIGAEATP